jgi:hypothetical protein
MNKEAEDLIAEQEKRLDELFYQLGRVPHPSGLRVRIFPKQRGAATPRPSSK